MMFTRSRIPIIVVAPDSFKGSLSARDAADSMKRGILRALPACDIRSYPMADGGEGTLDALLDRGGSRYVVSARNAAGVMQRVATGMLTDASAVIEVAGIVGITDPAGTAIPVDKRTTLGVGDALRALLDKGIKRVTIALGGSSTNDGGAGLLVALGMKMLDENGDALIPTPEALGRVARIDISGLDSRLAETSLLVMSDVNNPLTGKQGATAMFGAQKGVKLSQVRHLDANLARFADLLELTIKRSAQDIPGSGAAGGLGFALNMLGAKVCSGAEVIADALGLDAAMSKADWAITGEGCSDAQTLHGKVPYVVCQHGHRFKVPVTLVSGTVDPGSLMLLNRHFAGCFSLAPGPIDLSTAISEADSFLSNTAEQLAHLWTTASENAKLHIVPHK